MTSFSVIRRKQLHCILQGARDNIIIVQVYCLILNQNTHKYIHTCSILIQGFQSIKGSYKLHVWLKIKKKYL